MTHHYLSTTLTESVRRAQQHYYGRSAAIRALPERDVLGEDEAAFIAARDSFYLATVSETGWPYIQHRGGPIGFLRVLNPGTLAYADYQGNRQLISTGNLQVNDRVSLFLMDYRNRQRLKILGHARIMDARNIDEETWQLMGDLPRAKVERIMVIDVVGYDWNCPQHIKPRYTTEDVEELVANLRERISELEHELNRDGKEIRDRRSFKYGI
jgi:uncharacterized protein